MEDDRLRIPVDGDYVASLGRAAYVFAVMEWNAVWCCELLDDGYLNELGRKTAGAIAEDFARLAALHPDPGIRSELTDAAEAFRLLVRVRNLLLHGKPGTAPGGNQMLFDRGRAWTPELIDAAADDFAQCCAEL